MLEPGSQLGPYQVLGPLGEGGMGEVYRSHDNRLGRDVAVKVLRSDQPGGSDRMRRFELEARAASSLNHPNILAIHDIGTHLGAPYVVTELLEGDTLRDKLRKGPLPWRRALEYAAQIAHGLAAAHDKGIVHRDLKPENVFLTHDGRIKILDFGLAKLLEVDSALGKVHADSAISTAGPANTEPGTIMGTVGYMAPEQVRGDTVDARADIFAFGCVLYEMLTGRRAFPGDSKVEILTAILKTEPAELWQTNPGVPLGVERVLRRCLEKEPKQRFQSTRDLAFQLESLASPSAPSGLDISGANGALFGAAASNKTPKWLWALLGVGLLASIAAAFAIGLATHPRPVDLSIHQLTFRRGTLSTARLASDGQTIVYSASWEGKKSEVFLGRSDAIESRSLGLPEAQLLSLSRSGEMAILLQPRVAGIFRSVGTLARLPLTGGTPRSVLDDVEGADWAPTGDAMAVIRQIPNAFGWRLEYPIGNLLVTHPGDGWTSNLRISPDGTQLALLVHPLTRDDFGAVWVVDRAGKMRKVSSDYASVYGLAWGPGGQEIWFTGADAGVGRALRAVKLDGKERVLSRLAETLTLHDVAPDGRALISRDIFRGEMVGRPPGESSERDLGWLDDSVVLDIAKDGQKLLFLEAGEAGGARYATYLRGMDGSPALRLSEGNGNALSPDSRWVVLTDNIEQMVHTLTPTGTGESIPLDFGALQKPRHVSFFPDSKRLLVSGTLDGVTRIGIIDGPRIPVRLVGPPGYGFGGIFPISPDGKSVFVADANGFSMLSLETGQVRPLKVTANGTDVFNRWSDDGKSIYLYRRTLPGQLIRVDLETNARTLLYNLMPADHAGVVDVSYVAVTGDAKAYAYSFKRILSDLFLVEHLK